MECLTRCWTRFLPPECNIQIVKLTTIYGIQCTRQCLRLRWLGYVPKWYQILVATNEKEEPFQRISLMLFSWYYFVCGFLLFTCQTAISSCRNDLIRFKITSKIERPQHSRSLVKRSPIKLLFNIMFCIEYIKWVM